MILGIVPAIDLVAGLDRSNPPDDVIEALEQDRYYRWITYLFLPIQYVGFLGAMAVVGGWDAFGVLADMPLTTIDKIGLAISIGCIGGIGINTAHELGHKKEANERWLSKIALAQVFYGHFYIEHNRGHHVRVATPEDPASARLGENFYQFWPRTVGGSLKSAWRLEKRRLARRKQSPWRLDNDVLNAWLMSLALWVAVVAAFGLEVAPYLVIQAVVGFSLLEVVNYMEHYGMLRQKVGEGDRQRYERVLPGHSWNSNNIATNVLLYHLQRHSDHHANPTRRYQTLRDFEESPVLPTGYAGMIVLAIVPAVWRRVMDQRVVDHFGGDVSLANISPRKREAYLAPLRRRRPRRARRGRPGRRRGAAGCGRRGAGRPLPQLRVRLRGGRRRRARGLRGRHRLGRHPGRLVLPRLRRAREGRLRAGRARAVGRLSTLLQRAAYAPGRAPRLLPRLAAMASTPRPHRRGSRRD